MKYVRNNYTRKIGVIKKNVFIFHVCAREMIEVTLIVAQSKVYINK